MVGGWRLGGRRLLASWRCGIKSGSCESRVRLSVVLGSSSVLSSKTACMAQEVSGSLGGVTLVVVGSLGLRPLPYRIHIGRDLVRALGFVKREIGVAWVEEVVGVGVVVEAGVTMGVADAGVVVLVGVMVVVVVGEVDVGVVVVVVEDNGEVVVGVVRVLVVVVVGGVVVGELVVVVEVIGVVVGVAFFTRLRQRPYRIHIGSCLLRGISGGRVEGEVGVEGVVIEEVESGVVWGVEVVEVVGVIVVLGIRGGVVVVVVGVVVVVAGVGGSRLVGLA